MADSDQPNPTAPKGPDPMTTHADDVDADLARRAEENQAAMARIEAEGRERYAQMGTEARDAEKARLARAEAQGAALTARLLELAKNAPQDLPRDPHVPEWIDQYDPQAVRRGELFDQDVAECKATGVARYQLTDVEDSRAAQMIERWVVGAERKGAKINCVIQGPTGSGKTATAIAAGKEALRRGLRVRMVNHAHYMAMTRPQAPLPNGLTLAQYRARYSQADVLIVDDLGATLASGQKIDMDTPLEQVQGASPHVLERTMELIGDRATNGQYTLVTTNLRYPHVVALFGDRFGSRLSMELIAVKMEGRDKRGTNTDW